ncbi:MAG: hypothetical protein NUW01_08930 [Gemmatimonadaceae bacterium]|nr:hypothetical protein [Gemmatimonadaceae bacterium]
MTFEELQDAVLFNRFKESMRTPHVKRWLTSEYSYVWHAADWQFKRVTAFETGAELTVTAGDNTPTMPAAFAETISLLNHNGDPLLQLDPRVFEANYRNPSAGRGEPEAFTVVNRQVYLAPTPLTARTFYLAHRRLLCHKADGSTVTSGKMNSNADTTMWGEDHDEVLVAGARARGKKREQDPTWQADEAERDQLLTLMIGDLVAANVGSAYGRDTL